MKKLFFVPLILVVVLAFTDKSLYSINDIIDKLKAYEAAQYQEKLFLHLDRPVYSVGDDIWFQSYLVKAASLEADSYEKVLYVELINPEGAIATKKIFKLVNGNVSGQIKLEPDMPSGKYLMVAYSNWMRNYDANLFFTKEIKITAADESGDIIVERSSSDDVEQADSTNTVATQTKKPNIHLQFFPEGGELIEGITCKIAFHGVNEAGQDMVFVGKIIDDNNKVCAHLKGYDHGKGFFYLQPEPGRTYRAVVFQSRDNTITIPIPKAQPQGYRMGMINRWNEDTIQVLIKASGASLKSSRLKLIGQQDGMIKLALEGKLNNGVLDFPLTKDVFSTGIVQFTLFDENNVPQCERLLFINKQERLNIQIDGLEQMPEKRGKMRADISITTPDGKPAKGAFSISVTDANMITDEAYSKDNLVTHMYLTSNLPGNIKNADYLLRNNARSQASLDLLMLVNGWRRFSWEKVFLDSIPKPQYQMEQGIFIDGLLKRPSGKRTAPKGIDISMLMIGNNSGGVDVAETDENGRFSFQVNDFTDTMDVVIQTRNRLNNKADFSISLESNLRFEASDFNARRYMANEQAMVPTTIYESESLVEGEVRAIGGGMKQEFKRLLDQGFFQDSTDILLDDVQVKGKKAKNPQEEITEKYGAQNQVIGQRQIEDLIKDTPWQYGLISLLYNAFPGLRISEIPDYQSDNSLFNTESEEIDSMEIERTSDFESVANQRTVQFTMTNSSPYQFYIYVDGEIVGVTDENGRLSVMSNTITVDALIGMDPEVIKSLELILSPSESPMNDMMADAQELINLSGSREAILSIYTKNNTGIYSRAYNKGITNFRLFGYQRTREFYSPQYNGTDDAKIMRDERATLLWNPLLETDEYGKAHIEFYNTDVATAFRVDIAGFSESRIPGASVQVKQAEGLEQLLTSSSSSTQTTDDVSDKYQQNFTESQELASNTNLLQGHVALSNGQVARFADVSIIGKSLGTITNEDGYFAINKELLDENDKLLLNHAGDETAQISLQELTEAKAPLLLKKVHTLTADLDIAEKVVKQMIKKVRANTATRAYYISAAYRETIKKGRDLYRLSDFNIIQKKESYIGAYTPHATMPIAGRLFRTEDYPMQVKYEPLNTLDDLVPVLDPLQKNIHFLLAVADDYYDFTHKGMIDYQGRPMHKISFDAKDKINKPLQMGTFIIDAETYGLAYVQWKLSAKNKRYEVPQMYLMPGKTISKFATSAENNEAFYQLIGEKWYLKSALQQVTVKVDGTMLSFNRQIAVTSILENRPKKFKAQAIDKMDKRLVLIKNVSYRPEFWRDGWVLPTDKYIEEQVIHLHEVTFYK